MTTEEKKVNGLTREPLKIASKAAAELALSSVIDKPKNVQVFLKYLGQSGLDDIEYRRAVYQVVGDIIMLGGGSIKPVLKNLKKGKINWEHLMFEPFEEKIQEHDDYIVHPFDVAEGVSECGKCGSKRTYSSQKQVRSSDEPMTTFSRCAKCGHSWSYAG